MSAEPTISSSWPTVTSSSQRSLKKKSSEKTPASRAPVIYGTAKEHLAVIIDLVNPPPPSYFENKDKVMKSTTTSSITIDAPDPTIDEIWPVVPNC